MGTAWGLSQPLTKISVSTGYAPFGLIFWELVFMLIVLAAFQFVRRKSFGLAWRHLHLYLAIAVLGTVFPNYISFRSAFELPAGVMSIIIAIVPMFAVPVAVAMGNEKAGLVRFAGIGAGATAILLLLGPNAHLPPNVSTSFVLTALLAPVSYAFEGNYLAKWGTSELDAAQILFGACIVATLLSCPLMFLTGSYFTVFKPWDLPLYALLGSTFLHVIAYGGYVWIVGKAGPVFAAQVSYIVTATGICWAMLILGERYSSAIWAAFALMMAGIALVRPRPKVSEAIP